MIVAKMDFGDETARDLRAFVPRFGFLRSVHYTSDTISTQRKFTFRGVRPGTRLRANTAAAAADCLLLGAEIATPGRGSHQEEEPPSSPLPNFQQSKWLSDDGARFLFHLFAVTPHSTGTGPTIRF